MTRQTFIKFSNRYVTPILKGNKTATIRYGWKKRLETGDTLVMQAPGGEVFGCAETVSASEMTIADAALTDIPGHVAYESVDDCIAKLSHFYPATKLTPNSDVTVIRWQHACEPAAWREYRKWGVTP